MATDELRYLEVPKDAIPLQLTISIEGQLYDMLFQYNSKYDFFTVTLIQDEHDIITGEKILLDKPFFTTAESPFKNTLFIPQDLSGIHDRLSFDNFDEDIFIYYFTRESEDDDFE